MDIRVLFQAVTTAGTPPVDQDFDVSGVTETPVALVAEATSSGGAVANHYRYSGGFTDGTTHRAMAGLAEDNVLLNADAEIRFDTDTIFQSTLTTSNAINGEARLSAFHAGGSRWTWDDLCATGLRAKTTYFLGDDVEVAVVDVVGSSSVNGTVPVSGLPFAPNFIMAIGHYGAWSTDATSAPLRIGLGYAVRAPDGSTQQIALTDRQSDRPSVPEGTTIIRDDCFFAKLNNGSEGARLSVTAWNADGVTVTTLNTAESVTTAILIARFSGARLYAGIPGFVTSSTGDKPITGMGFKPFAYFTLGTALTAKNTLESGAASSMWCHGCCDSANTEASVTVQAQDGGDTGTSDTRSDAQAKIVHLIDNVGATSLQISHVSKDNDGITVNVGTASAADWMVGICAIGFGLSTEETVAVQEGAIFVTSAIQANEQVDVQEAAILVRSAIETDEQVDVQETLAFASAAAIAEQVDVQEAIVFKTETAVTDVVLVANEQVDVEDATVLLASESFVANEQVDIGDSVVFPEAQTLVVDEQVDVQETASFVYSTLQIEEQVDVIDSGVFWGTGVLTEVNETVTVAEGVVFVPGTVFLTAEQVDIGDGFSFGAGLVPSKGSPGRGRTVEGGPERGRTVDGGAVAGGGAGS